MYTFGTKLNKSQILENTNYNPKQFKFIAHNTLEGIFDNTRIIRHYTTDILTFVPDGTIIFDTGGTFTRTTRKRMNEYQDLVYLWQNKHVMYASAQRRIEYGNMGRFHMAYDPHANTFIYADGMNFHPDTGFANVGCKPNKKMVKALRKYSKDFVTMLPINMPSSGDCLYCGMKVTGTNISLGDAHKDTDHLISHIFEDKYYVPALLMNALEEANRGDYIKACVFKSEHQEDYLTNLLTSFKSQIAKDIYNYLYKRIIIKSFPKCK